MKFRCRMCGELRDKSEHTIHKIVHGKKGKNQRIGMCKSCHDVIHIEHPRQEMERYLGIGKLNLVTFMEYFGLRGI